jgi:hypothetical protein
MCCRPYVGGSGLSRFEDELRQRCRSGNTLHLYPESECQTSLEYNFCHYADTVDIGRRLSSAI